MMTLEDVVTMLESTGMDLAYQHFNAEDDPQMPFLTYQEVASNNFSADDKTYAKFSHMYVTLWQTKKDAAAEQNLENVFDGHDIPWSKNESYLETEQIYEITYEVEV